MSIIFNPLLVVLIIFMIMFVMSIFFDSPDVSEIMFIMIILIIGLLISEWSLGVREEITNQDNICKENGFEGFKEGGYNRGILYYSSCWEYGAWDTEKGTYKIVYYPYEQIVAGTFVSEVKR